MNHDFEKTLSTKSDEDLEKYLQKDSKYVPTAIETAIKIFSNQLEVLSFQDYYPYGLSMRGYEQNYSRYNTFQGEYAEREPETGLGQFEVRNYSSIVGRWLNVDPNKQHNSPYLAMRNNPISFVDPDGRDDIYYNRQGLEIGRTPKLGKHKYYLKYSSGTHSFSGNNYIRVNSKETIRGGDGGQGWSGLYDISVKTQIDLVFEGLSDVESPLGFASESRSRGDLDFKRKLPQDKLIGIDGIYYNTNEAGNYFWGAASRAFGFTATTTFSGAQLYKLAVAQELDEAHEVRAIFTGYQNLGFLMRSLYGGNTFTPKIRQDYPNFKPNTVEWLK